MPVIEQSNALSPPPAQCPHNKTFVTKSLHKKLLEMLHTSLSTGCPGITGTLNLLQNKFWWPIMSTDTTTFNNCNLCNTSKSSHQRPAGLQQLLHPQISPNLTINHTVILTVVDRFSKACRLIPMPKLPNAFKTGEALCNCIFRFYGLPEDIVSDRGPQFTSNIWSAFFKQLNVNISLTSGYHPQSN